jgi:hypothetical protein
MAANTITTTNDAGRCPCTPEAHQRAGGDTFGDIFSCWYGEGFPEPENFNG